MYLLQDTVLCLSNFKSVLVQLYSTYKTNSIITTNVGKKAQAM